MRWLRFEHEGRRGVGIIEDNRISEVESMSFGAPLRTGHTLSLAEVELLPPVVPRTFYAVGINCLQHVRDTVASGLATQIPTQPDVGYRASNALIGADAPIVIPADSSGKLQFEGDLVVVIGRTAKHLSKGDALSCVFGYSIGNDVSERSWKNSDRTLWRAKNADTFKPMGPWIETDVDLDALVTRVRLNGNEVSRFKTNDVVFGVADYISMMTRYVTLYPGDIIWMGTDDPALDTVAGDTVEVAIDGIGVLRNTVVADG